MGSYATLSSDAPPASASLTGFVRGIAQQLQELETNLEDILQRISPPRPAALVNTNVAPRRNPQESHLVDARSEAEETMGRCAKLLSEIDALL